MAILSLLAGLILGTTAYARRKALETKTRSQLQQIALALDMYKNDYGVFPITPADAPKTNKIAHVFNAGTTNNSLVLYSLLTGYAVTDGPPNASTGKNYYPELKNHQLQRTDGTNYLVDPYRNVWGYFNTTNNAWKANQFNQRTYDLWSFGLKPNDPTNSLISNWRQQ